MDSVHCFARVLALAPLAFAGAVTQQTEDAKLTAPGSVTFDQYGSSVAVSGTTVIVGAAGEDDVGVTTNSGAVYVYTRLGATWTEQARLTPLDAADFDVFGHAASIYGDAALIGAPEKNVIGPRSGAAYVFARSGTVWTETQRLVPSDGAMNQSFGAAVSISGDRALVGAEGDGGGFGAAYVFERIGSAWVEQTKLKSPSPGRFGSTVAIDGDVAVVGAPQESPAGGAYAFVRQGTSWALADIRPSDLTSEEEYGNAVAVSGDTAVVGMWKQDGSGPDSGAAYVFVRQGTNWNQQQMLTASDASARDYFGSSVSISGDRLVVGASQAGASAPGASYLFVREGTTWTERAKYVASDGVTGDDLGANVAISGETFVAGARHDDDGGLSSGSAYVFTPPEAPPSFCDAVDGSLATCPCANPGGPETGCDVQQGTGGVGLTLAAQETSPNNRVTWIGSGYPETSFPPSVVIRSASLEAAPVIFGDGLRCIGIPLVRFGTSSAVDGTSVHTHGHGAGAGSGSFYYQLWFRNSPIMFCDPSAAFNLSNGRTLVW